MKTAFVCFANHFDLVWRRCWDREYDYEGGRYTSYRRIEELCLQRNIELAEQGQGAYLLEQTLSLRAYLERHPADLRRLQRLYEKGLFEVSGAGEAIIDTNMCSGETMCRNLASGLHHIQSLFGVRPTFAYYSDGFGSSAQLPQVIRQCGLRGIHAMSYSYPTHPYWKGLDGSTVFFLENMPGRLCFYDHCYHEPCCACRNLKPKGCPECRGTGLDLPQNHYPSFQPIPNEAFRNDLAYYQIMSEEMLPPEDFARTLRTFEKAHPGARYRFGTPRHLAALFEQELALADNPPRRQTMPRVENNPTHTACLVSRIRSKLLARRCEAAFYGWETALALSLRSGPPSKWEKLFLQLPHFFFHDAVTGTHQDPAHEELKDQMQAVISEAESTGVAALRSRSARGWESATGGTLSVFNPSPQPAALRVFLPISDWRRKAAWVAETEDGKKLPVTFSWHGFGPAQPKAAGRLITATGPDSRTRPAHGEAWIEAQDLPPLAWSRVRIRPTKAPVPIRGSVLKNRRLRIGLGKSGIDFIEDAKAGRCALRRGLHPGELMIEEDVGDPWGTSRPSGFRRSLADLTHLLGALRFDGYQEAYYAGEYEPNLRFGHEQDPELFALSWYVTVRLLDDSPRVDFLYEIFWKTVNRRLRVIFPTPAGSDRGIYSIPCGWLRRERYERKPDGPRWTGTGDWPALNFFAALNRSPRHGWALVNYGTPSARIEDGCLNVSLLRSPGFGHCLERYAQAYPMPTSGIRDGGWHHFTLSLLPFDGEADLPRLSVSAIALNQRPPVVLAQPKAKPAGLRLQGTGIELAAIKFPFNTKDRLARIVRLINHNAIATRCVLTLNKSFHPSADACTMTEETQSALTVRDGQIELNLRPFEVKTLRLRMRATPSE